MSISRARKEKKIALYFITPPVVAASAAKNVQSTCSHSEIKIDAALHFRLVEREGLTSRDPERDTRIRAENKILHQPCLKIIVFISHSIVDVFRIQMYFPEVCNTSDETRRSTRSERIVVREGAPNVQTRPNHEIVESQETVFPGKSSGRIKLRDHVIFPVVHYPLR